MRNPDPSANPYLAMAVMLKAGLDGIKNQIDPGEQALSNIYDMSPRQRQEKGITSLTKNIMEAINHLKKDEIIRETLGKHIFKHFVEAKEIEWDVYKTQVHQWELDQYLLMF